MNDKVTYNNSSTLIPPNNFNIFSLLYFLSINKIMSPKNINLEREGLLYWGEIIPIHISPDKNIVKYILDFKKNPNSIHRSIIENTDIFTWALFKDESKRYITVDYNSNDIIECVFTNGLITMYARNVKYIN